MKTPFFFMSVLFVVVISGFCAESQVLVSEDKLPGRHFQLTQVQLVDQTDKHNELVQTGNWLLHRSESTLKLKGNLFVLHDNHTNRGWIFVRQSPLPEARPVTPQTDIEIRRKKDHVMVRLFRTDDEKVDDLWQKVILAYMQATLVGALGGHAWPNDFGRVPSKTGNVQYARIRPCIVFPILQQIPGGTVTGTPVFAKTLF